jgi:dTDP-4-amino-4,6-dideoxygalactose transaminase
VDESAYVAVKRVLDRGVLSGRDAPEITALEREFAAMIGTRVCYATNSGTAALHMALAAAEIGPGDEVIVPALTYVATAQAVMQQGATPVFADVDADTYNINSADAASRVTPRTRAIIAVHLHGLPADMAAIRKMAGRSGLVVIEDAAQAHGATHQGRPVGRLGDMAAFSLNSTKNVPAGEGGLFVTESLAFSSRAARLRTVGLHPDREWDPLRPLDRRGESLATTVGWMYLPDEMTAAVARVQLSRLAAITAQSQSNARLMTERLSRLVGVEPPVVPDDCTHVFHKYRVRLDPARLGVHLEPKVCRDFMLRALRAEGVEAVLWQTVPIPAHPLFNVPEPYPYAQALLDSSIILGSQSYPLFAQPAAVIDSWADAFEKVWTALPELAARNHAIR